MMYFEINGLDIVPDNILRFFQCVSPDIISVNCIYYRHSPNFEKNISSCFCMNRGRGLGRMESNQGLIHI